MSEKLYKIVSGVGAGSIALGIITLVTGVSTGILMIVIWKSSGMFADET